MHWRNHNLFSFYLFFAIIFLSNNIIAKDKKSKQKSPYKKANIIQKAWGDLTTRNNWYFNANERYKEALRQNDLNKKIDYSKTIPFYLYNPENMKNYAGEFQTIEKKMGIVLQIRNYGRWRDNCYLLLGKAQYLQDKIDTSLITFQYIVTTMKPDKINAQVSFSNKDRMKYLRKREKELKKKAGEQQKIIEFKLSQQKKETEKKADDLREKQQEAVANKKQQLEEIIKAKKKIIALQKKGKKIPPELLAKVKPKTNKTDTTKTITETPKPVPSKKQEIDKNKPYILIDDELVKNPYYVDTTNRDKDAPLKEELSKKEEEKWNKLSFWEKIKHKQSRPEALVWMAKSLIDLDRDADAQSIIAYSKALRKLTKKQKKDIYLVDAYYNLNKKNVPLAIEKLENAILFIKKKDEKAHYEFILAQLYQQNTQPADAVDYFEKVIKHTTDEKLAFYSKLKMTDIFAHYPELTDKNIEKMLTKLVRFGKNKDEADEVYYEMALYALNNNTDTTKAIEYLKKSVEVSTINTTQKGLSYLRLGKIYFDKELYANAKNNYDSTIAFLPKDHTEFPEAELRQSVLEDLASYVKIIQEQDSLQKLGKLSPKELEKYLADLQAAKDKVEKKKSKLSVEENEGGFLTTTDTKTNYSSNGLWYFYNQELKSNGYKQFKSVWGNRPLEPNWRRSTKSIFETEDNAANNTIVTEEKTKSKDKVIESKLKIPKTPEDFIASDKLIADALYNVGVIFKNKLKNIPKSKQAFDELIQRFPNSEYDAIAHYYQYLIYLEQNLNGLAEKEKNYILENYPFSDVAQKLNNNSNNNTTQQIENANSFYASTYQAYLSGDYNKVLDNKKTALKKYPEDAALAQFDFLEALVYGKQKEFKKYKQALSDIILKYPNTEIKQKAQDFLIAYIQFENNIKDSTKNISNVVEKIKDTTIIPKINFEFDTLDFLIIIKLNNPYFKLQSVVSDLKAYLEAKASGMKVKVNPVFFNNNETIITLRKFETVEEASPLLLNLNIDKQKLFKELSESVSYYLIANSNLKLIKSYADLDEYEKYFNKKYIDNE
jgi:tetratricopeptide (TPR) repeat protein